MVWYYLYLDDLYNWMSGIETIPETPVNSPKTVVHRIQITDSFIDELKEKLSERKKRKTQSL